ncbi:MAG TPA: iron-containing alcohol dehydrogenase [Polyangiaceae bacterium]|nr:iron-containing alcohol dehydrogenase [Polyangiaceae bacterium]
MAFDFATANEVVFGRGRLTELPARARGFGERALVVTGSRVERAERVLALLRGAGLECSAFSVSGEPTLEIARDGVSLAREANASLVVALGGGSVIDAGKAIAALLGNGGDPLDYAEVVGKGRKIDKPSLPFIAVPTTAGTGAEVTRNAVLASHEHRVKVSLRSPHMLPRLALVDSELTHSVPPDVTAATGLDALTQVLEPYVSNAANPLVDALCLEGMARGARSLRRAFHDGSDADAREDMALCSLFGGLCLANAKLGAVHGFAAPLGGSFTAPHGALCARLLPLVIATNIRALQARAPASPVLARYETVARVLTGKPDARAEDAAAWAEELVSELRIPALRSYGMSASDIPDIVAKARQASSMKGNPIALEEAELGAILERAL